MIVRGIMGAKILLAGAFAAGVGALAGLVLSELNVPVLYAVLAGAVVAQGLSFFLLFGRART